MHDKCTLLLLSLFVRVSVCPCVRGEEGGGLVGRIEERAKKRTCPCYS